MTSSATAEIRPRAEAHTAGIFVAVTRKVGCNGSYGVKAVNCGAVLGECADKRLRSGCFLVGEDCGSMATCGIAKDHAWAERAACTAVCHAHR